MTNKLPQEIIDNIEMSMNKYVDKYMYHSLGMRKILEEHLGPYLSVPKQEEPIDMKDHRRILLGWDKGAEGGDKSCNVYGYYKDGKFYITNIEYYEGDTTPIEKIDLTKDDDYWEATHNKINEIIDTVNSLISKQNDDEPRNSI